MVATKKSKRREKGIKMEMRRYLILKAGKREREARRLNE